MLTVESGKLRVAWVIPSVSPPITHTMVSIRVAGTKCWHIVDTTGGSLVDGSDVYNKLVTTGGAPVKAPTSSIWILGLAKAKTYEAMVSMGTATTCGNWSLTSDPVTISADVSNLEDQLHRKVRDLQAQLDCERRRMQRAQYPSRSPPAGSPYAFVKSQRKPPDILGLLFMQHDVNGNGVLEAPEIGACLEEVFGEAVTPDIINKVLSNHPGGVRRMTPSGNLCSDFYKVFEDVDNLVHKSGWH